jgi:hypothetical protein
LPLKQKAYKVAAINKSRLENYNLSIGDSSSLQNADSLANRKRETEMNDYNHQDPFDQKIKINSSNHLSPLPTLPILKLKYRSNLTSVNKLSKERDSSNESSRNRDPKKTYSILDFDVIK